MAVARQAAIFSPDCLHPEQPSTESINPARRDGSRFPRPLPHVQLGACQPEFNQTSVQSHQRLSGVIVATPQVSPQSDRHATEHCLIASRSHDNANVQYPIRHAGFLRRAIGGSTDEPRTNRLSARINLLLERLALIAARLAFHVLQRRNRAEQSISSRGALHGPERNSGDFSFPRQRIPRAPGETVTSPDFLVRSATGRGSAAFTRENETKQREGKDARECIDQIAGKLNKRKGRLVSACSVPVVRNIIPCLTYEANTERYNIKNGVSFENGNFHGGVVIVKITRVELQSVCIRNGGGAHVG